MTGIRQRRSIAAGFQLARITLPAPNSGRPGRSHYCLCCSAAAVVSFVSRDKRELQGGGAQACRTSLNDYAPHTIGARAVIVCEASCRELAPALMWLIAAIPQLRRDKSSFIVL
jgi:hypothetical protein